MKIIYLAGHWTFSTMSVLSESVFKDDWQSVAKIYK